MANRFVFDFERLGINKASIRIAEDTGDFKKLMEAAQAVDKSSREEVSDWIMTLAAKANHKREKTAPMTKLEFPPSLAALVYTNNLIRSTSETSSRPETRYSICGINRNFSEARLENLERSKPDI